MADQTFAVHCGFFDAINSDRTYSADEMIRPYRRIISNGVFATPQGNPSTDLQVVESTGMNIICKAGEGLFADKWFENPSSIVITVPNNTSTVPRIDSVLVQVDTRTSGRVGNIVYRTGTPASSPVPPTINQTEGVVEYRLANIRVNAGVTSIQGRYITDRRGSSDCPWVTSLIYQVDTSTLYDQWQAAYAEYFEEEKAIWDAWYAQLTEDLDVSMTLDRHTNTVTTTAQTTGYIPIGLAYNHNTDILEVYINGLRAVEGTHYVVVDDTKILVENQLQIGQTVTFVVMRSVISGSATNITVLLQELESQIAGIAGGTPTVVDSASNMTDTEKIYVLSSDSKWYYYSATQEDWVIGGTYGGVPTDTTLTQHGMAADAKAVGDALALKADASDVTALDTRVTAVEGDLTQLQLGNLPKTIIKNSYVAVTGEIIAHNGWDRTEYIPVNKYYSIVAKSSVSSAYNVFFDENFDKIGSNFTVGTTDTTVLVPTGAKYIVFSNTAAGMQNLETHYVTKTENTATGVKNAYFLDQEGKLPYYIVNNERITNLGVVETKPGWDRTEYIPVSKYKKLVAKSSASSPYNVFYAEDKVTKVGNAITVGTTDTEISIPSGAHYIIFSNTAAGMQDFECVYTLKNIYMNDINQGLAVVMPPIDETINYNTDTKTLSIPSGTSVYFGTNLRNVTATNLSITVSNRVRINYDYVNDTFSATAFNVPTPENNVLFAILRRDTYGKKVSMAINAPYTIDGVPYGVKPPSERYVPEYYKTYIQGKAVEINELESGLNGDSFIFLTDYHRQSNKKNSPSLVKYLMENTGARFVMFGGDAQDYEETLDDAVKETMGFKEDFASERDCLFCAIGNHEFNYHYHNLDPEQYPASIKMTYNQIYSLLLKQNEHLFGALNSYGDYWFDNAVQKIRYFVIGCDEGSGISSIQFVWFLEQLLLVPNGYTVFVFSHATFKQKGDIIAGRTHIYVYDYVEKMANALEALGNSQTYTFNNVVYDFSNKDVTRGIIIGGHTHFDANTQDYEYLVNYSDQSISWDITPIICVTTDAISRYRTDTEIITRTAGTTSEQAFDYVRIDKTNKTVTFKRIGAGSDRVISY